jgi:hypothetical protein
MTTYTVDYGQVSSGIITSNSGSDDLILCQSGVARTAFIGNAGRLPALSGSVKFAGSSYASEAASLSGGETDPAPGGSLIYLLLAIFTVLLMLALVVVPESNLTINDPISFARGPTFSCSR